MKTKNTNKYHTYLKPEERQDSDRDMPRKKKGLGQNFLRKQSVVDNMIAKVLITAETSVLEIGCGDGFLTQSILEQTKCKKLVCYEIDPDWVTYVSKKIKNPRLEIRLKNILESNFPEELGQDKPWVILANLPYQITFPIIFLIQQNKSLFQEGVIMVQEEVAQKIVAKRGKGYSTTSLLLQYNFDWTLMDKIEPAAFTPAPKVHSRLLHFKPKFDQQTIPDEEEFWRFLKLCFRSPRQTLKNNIKTTHYFLSAGWSDELLNMRAQQLSFDDFLKIWQHLNK
jgi:16S rRNA (adenine1518-N6/adenine1519-N6)-dimethyltransferase